MLILLEKAPAEMLVIVFESSLRVTVELAKLKDLARATAILLLLKSTVVGVEIDWISSGTVVNELLFINTEVRGIGGVALVNFWSIKLALVSDKPTPVQMRVVPPKQVHGVTSGGHAAFVEPMVNNMPKA